ncbi:MAG: DUF202 domain-containing protein [Planctomycetaceae bacterium]|nr:DUF202 domain-containing protein [Planctomycetaceae bacterium]
MPDKQLPQADSSTFFAAERTLLAWIRTGLAMMGFGFVVARFGLFLREIAAVRNTTPHHNSGLSLGVGVALVLLGVGVQLFATLRHWKIVRQLKRGDVIQFSPFSLGTTTALFLALLGIITASYLLFLG